MNARARLKRRLNADRVRFIGSKAMYQMLLDHCMKFAMERADAIWRDFLRRSEGPVK